MHSSNLKLVPANHRQQESKDLGVIFSDSTKKNYKDSLCSTSAYLCQSPFTSHVGGGL
jgi:hypothetical protein